MCTAVTMKARYHYFGRNLDLEYAYHEAVTITPRNFPVHFRKLPTMQTHYAMIGMATLEDNYPLYYEATNEAGLSMAGLNFPGLAVYQQDKPGCDQVASFELIPWILGQCSTVAQAKKLLERINITDEAFSDAFPPSPLHWLLADSDQAITLEAMADGLHIHSNPLGVLTNNPPFPYHMFHLQDHMQLSAAPAVNLFSQSAALKPYSNGMGSASMPGGWDSASRFVRGTFVKLNSLCDDSEEACVNQFFHILNSVSMPRGCIAIPPDRYEITLYSSCCNTDRGIYYYTSYENSRVTAVDLHKEPLDGSSLISYPLLNKPDFYHQN